eukprot:gene4386-14511_t
MSNLGIRIRISSSGLNLQQHIKRRIKHDKKITPKILRISSIEKCSKDLRRKFERMEFFSPEAPAVAATPFAAAATPVHAPAATAPAVAATPAAAATPVTAPAVAASPALGEVVGAEVAGEPEVDAPGPYCDTTARRPETDDEKDETGKGIRKVGARTQGIRTGGECTTNGE